MESIEDIQKNDKLKGKIEIEIERGNYQEVDNLIMMENLNINQLNFIVHSIYISNNFKFMSLKTYSLMTKYPNISYHILKQLSVELNQDELSAKNFNQICDIYYLFQRKLINSKNPTNRILIEDAKLITNKLGEQIVNYSVKKLKSGILSEQSLTNMEQKLADKVLTTNEFLSHQVICQLINETYHKLTFRYLIQRMWQFEMISQKASAICCIFSKLYQNFYNNPEAIMIIASYLKKLKNFDDFQYLFDTKKFNEIEEIIEKKLPSSLKNLYFAENICIRNVYTHSLLGTEVKFDDYKHWTYAINGEIVTEHNKWFVKSVNENHFRFINKKYQNEHLYCGRYKFKLPLYYRLVLTWIVNNYRLENEMIDRITWSITPFENGITISNNAYPNELLCLSEGSNKGIYRNVVSTKVYSNDDLCRWTLESC